MTEEGFTINQDYLRSHFEYDENTGILIRRSTGQPVGSLDTTTGYLRTQIKGKSYYIHRLSWMYMFGDFTDGIIDHIDRDKTNNRTLNLRLVTQKENQRNRSVSVSNKSGYSAVYYRKDRDKWAVRVTTLDGVYLSLGCYDTLEDAVTVRNKAYKENGYINYEEEL